MILKLNSLSPIETFEIGKCVGKNLKGDEIILLCGDLGSGKTLMTKGIAASLGIDPDEIVSPTFTLMNQYPCRGNNLQGGKKPSVLQLIHFDCYRFSAVEMDKQSKSRIPKSAPKKKEVQCEGLALPEIDEWIDSAVVVIEWGQFLHHSYFALPKAISINFLILSPRERSIEIQSKLDYIQV